MYDTEVQTLSEIEKDVQVSVDKLIESNEHMSHLIIFSLDWDEQDNFMTLNYRRYNEYSEEIRNTDWVDINDALLVLGSTDAIFSNVESFLTLTDGEKMKLLLKRQLSGSYTAETNKIEGEYFEGTMCLVKYDMFSFGVCFLPEED